MHPYQAYRNQPARSMPRIELILAMYRKALENLARARQALTDGQADAAQRFLVNTQLIVSGLSADLPAYRDDSAATFLRLYEFVAHKMTLGTIESIDGASKVLRPLLEGFEAIHDQALAIESQGGIPSLDASRQVCASA